MAVSSLDVIRVSVITPVYNGAEYIGACMESVAHSVCGKRIVIDHIIVDDGSSDATRDIVAKTAAKFRQNAFIQHYSYSLICLPHCGKPAAVRNRGIREAQGQYIFCLDHDDILLQSTLHFLAHHLDETKTDVVYGDFLRCDEKLTYELGNDYCGRNYPDAATALASLFRGEHYFQHSFMFSKRVWSEIGGYDEVITFGEDFDLCVRFILAGYTLTHFPITTHLHRNHNRSLTSCYDPIHSFCPVRLAEHRWHYQKHAAALLCYLAAEEIAAIEAILQCAPDGDVVQPLSKEFAEKLAADRSFYQKRPGAACDIA